MTLVILPLAILTLGGCSALQPQAAPPNPVAVATPEQSPVRMFMETMNSLSTGDPARKADVFYEIERDYTRAPTTLATLRYAVALVTAGHPATKPAEGKRLLETLLATPERMLSDERLLATTLLNETTARLQLEAEIRRLRETLDERGAAQANLDKRMQALTQENAQLRRDLIKAEITLNQIKEIERSLNERSPTSPGSRDTTPSQTQGTPPRR